MKNKKFNLNKFNSDFENKKSHIETCLYAFPIGIILILTCFVLSFIFTANYYLTLTLCIIGFMLFLGPIFYLRSKYMEDEDDDKS